MIAADEINRLKVDRQRALEALARLVKIGQSDTGQSRRVANFLLAWWNAERDGGFDFTDLWNVDRAIADDMLAVIALIARDHCYADTYGYQEAMEWMVREWRFRPAGRI